MLFFTAFSIVNNDNNSFKFFTNHRMTNKYFHLLLFVMLIHNISDHCQSLISSTPHSGALQERQLNATIGELFIVPNQIDQTSSGFSGITVITDLTEEEETQLKIFPNPSQQKINIEGILVEKVLIFNLQGTLIDSQSLKSNQLDIQFLKSGIYTIQIKGFNNQTYTSKLIKH